MSGKPKWSRKPSFTITAAYAEIVIYLQEQKADGVLPERLFKPLAVVEKKANRLREQLDARRAAQKCRVCGIHRASGIVCMTCWCDLPKEVREQWRTAKTDSQKREAARVIFTVCGNYAAAQQFESTPQTL